MSANAEAEPWYVADPIGIAQGYRKLRITSSNPNVERRVQQLYLLRTERMIGVINDNMFERRKQCLQSHADYIEISEEAKISELSTIDSLCAKEATHRQKSLLHEDTTLKYLQCHAHELEGKSFPAKAPTTDNHCPFFFGYELEPSWYALYLMWIAESCGFYSVDYLHNHVLDPALSNIQTSSAWVHAEMNTIADQTYCYIIPHRNDPSTHVIAWLSRVQKAYNRYINSARTWQKWTISTKVQASTLPIRTMYFDKLLMDHDTLEYSMGCFERALRRYVDIIDHDLSGWPLYEPGRMWSMGDTLRFYRANISNGFF